MRIAFVCPNFYPQIGGVETVVFQLASNLAAKGHEVVVLTQKPKGESTKDERIDNFKVLRFGIFGAGELKISLGLLNYLKKNSKKFDLIHAHNYHSFPALAVVLSKKVPLIFSPHYHGTGHSVLTRLIHYPYRFIGKYIFSKSDAIICDTESESKLVEKHFPIVRNPVVLSLGIDVKGIRGASKFTGQPGYILSVGRLESYKNAGMIIKALKFIDTKIFLVLVGEGPLIHELKNLANRLKLKNRVSFLGNISEKELFMLYKNAGVFVTMSEMEAYGLSLLEAAAAKIGIVASDIPAHTELKNKFLIDMTLLSAATSPKILADSITKAMLKPAKAGKILPSWPSVTEQALNIYKKVLEVRAKNYA